jgi:hypothetical protein
LFASVFLNFNVLLLSVSISKIKTYLSQLFAVLLLLEFLPSPVNFHILLVAGDNFSVDFIVSLLLELFL